MGFRIFVIGFVVGLLGTGCATFPFDLGTRLLYKSAPSIVKLKGPTGGGTGFQVQAPNGSKYLVSNGHVCESAENGIMEAQVDGAEGVPVKVLQISDETDLCLLEPLPDAPALQLAPGLSRQQHVYVVGHPYLRGLTLSDGYIVESTIVELLEPELSPEQCTGPSRKMEVIPIMFGVFVEMCVRSVKAIDTSVEIYPGNSGSPALNSSGRVIGVMFAGDTRTNYGAFVPLEDLVKFLEQAQALQGQ